MWGWLAEASPALFVFSMDKLIVHLVGKLVSLCENRGAIADLHAELEKEPYGEGAAIYRIKAKDYGWGRSNEC